MEAIIIKEFVCGGAVIILHFQHVIMDKDVLFGRKVFFAEILVFFDVVNDGGKMDAYIVANTVEHVWIIFVFIDNGLDYFGFTINAIFEGVFG
jgi:hypothetical protein